MANGDIKEVSVASSFKTFGRRKDLETQKRQRDRQTDDELLSLKGLVCASLRV